MNVGYNPTACPSGVVITYQNVTNISGFTAVYTNLSTSQTYTFNIPVNSSGTLGCIPAGNYSLSISKPGNNIILYFDCSCMAVTWTSAYFSSISVSSTTCNYVNIDFGY
jgi:acyl-CoA synthetase (AMP-forming)/AMP-acid ligase II